MIAPKQSGMRICEFFHSQRESVDTKR
jgi:hypothetical protein